MYSMREGNVFTGVCNSVHGGGGEFWLPLTCTSFSDSYHPHPLPRASDPYSLPLTCTHLPLPLTQYSPNPHFWPIPPPLTKTNQEWSGGVTPPPPPTPPAWSRMISKETGGVIVGMSQNVSARSLFKVPSLMRSKLPGQNPRSGLKTQTKDFGLANLDWLRGNGSYSDTFIRLKEYEIIS